MRLPIFIRQVEANIVDDGETMEGGLQIKIPLPSFVATTMYVLPGKPVRLLIFTRQVKANIADDGETME